MKVTIDREECISCEVCWSDCPDVFEQNSEDDLCQITEKFRVENDPATGEIPDDLVDAAKEAADQCPVEVIHVG